MAATMQTAKAPVAQSMASMRPRMARSAAFRQVNTSSIQPAVTFGRIPSAKAMKASSVTTRSVVVVRAADDKGKRSLAPYWWPWVKDLSA